MNIGFTGHRDKLANEFSLFQIEQDYPGATWIHGGAEGFDTQVHRIALQLGKVEGETLIVIRPDYRKYPAKVAPVMRNQQIVDACTLLVACYDGRKTGGTHDCVERGKAAAKQREFRIKYLSPIGG